jgi:hypothetical protein
MELPFARSAVRTQERGGEARHLVTTPNTSQYGANRAPLKKS